MVKIWRQGDVIVRQVSEVPKQVVEAATNEIRIASETGNPHVLKASKVYVPANVRGVQNRQQYVVLEEPTSMTHPQHAALDLLPGVYQVSTVRDYAPSARLLD